MTSRPTRRGRGGAAGGGGGGSWRGKRRERPGADADRPAERKPSSWSAEVELPSGVPALPVPDGFVDRAGLLGVTFEPGEPERLGAYLALLLATNQVMNLTAVRDPADAWDRHVLDSLTLLPVLAEAESADEHGALTVLDVGTGGGLPGMVLAIAMPGARFTLLDSTAKKCRFLEHAARELGLENVTVVHHRAEAAGQQRGTRVDSGGEARREGGLRESFDVVTARALGRLVTLAELTVPFARVGGLCALVKGEKADEELAEAKRALHLLHTHHAGTVETPTGRIVVLEKQRSTPKAYPRANGEPKRRPLGLDDEAPGSKRPGPGIGE